MSGLKKRSLMISGHATSVALEPEFWDALESLAQRQTLSLTQLIEHVDAERTGSLSSALRLAALAHYRET